MKKIHILGICGTFMGGLALIARELGFEVSGTDANVYPPMSTQLEESGITLFQGYKAEHLESAPDLVIIGNAMSRGNPMVEAVLDRGIPYTSGPQWLANNVLQDRWVIGVAGTHGKTTTTSILAWILEDAKLNPGFLIGGVAENFGLSARLGEHPFFVIEADEYDTAFFDKRSKFIHYRPRTAILNNLEFDHADIFDDLDAIKKQFHHLVRTIPGTGLIIHPNHDENIDDVIKKGCWSERQSISHKTNDNADWSIKPVSADYSQFQISFRSPDNNESYEITWPLIGQHNAMNAAAAIVAARHVGVTPQIACEALSSFKSVKRRMECLGVINNITVYDDFAHHPTAIEKTLEALRQHVGDARIISILEPRSNTMRMGIHKNSLENSLKNSDHNFIFQSADLDWDIGSKFKDDQKSKIYFDIDSIINSIVELTKPGDHILIMSNGGFGGIHNKLLDALK
ncbi:MAG: UDP-N-acetylmuramate:L-alanyl-gamma-D-glutamyl-meso-diaminopimelate ligase [Gammaproteobacteria bacterium]